MQRSEIKKLKKEIKRLDKILKLREKELEKARLLMDYDILTGLYNRRGFINVSEKFLKEIRLESVHAQRRRFNIKNFSIIFIDLDNLKTVNDLCGHKVGDKFIKTVANILQKYLREIDITGRWGGDEFVVGLVNFDEKQARKVAVKLRNKISAIKIPEAKSRVKFGASFGIIAARDGHHPIFCLSELIEKADMAMYYIKKEKGRGGFVAAYNDIKDKIEDKIEDKKID